METFENKLESEPKNRIMIFTGISGCGKDLILKQYLEAYSQPESVGFVSFGEKIAERLMKKRDSLKHHLDGFEIKRTVEEIIDEEVKNQPLVLNTHLVYEQNRTLQINLDSLKRLNPSSLAFVVADPNNIKKWRQEDDDRQREVEDLHTIDLQQKIALSVARTIAEANGIDFTLVRNMEGYVTDDLRMLSESIKKL